MGNTVISTGIFFVEGKQFLNTFVKGKMYIAEIRKDSNTLSIFPLAERFTAKYIKNSTEFRRAIEFHYKIGMAPTYDDYFVLKNLQKVN